MKILKKNYKKEIVLANIMRILLILSMVISIKTQSWLNLFIAISTFVLTYLPYIIARKNGIKLPASFQIVILSFIFAAQILGELGNYYYKFWWWDIMLHTFSGVILGMVGFLLIYILNREEKIDLIMSPFFVALFSFTFALCMGALWEIFEFSMDSIFGLNMQKSGLVDTMWDLIVDSIGALITSINGYFYQKRHQQVPVFKEFFDENPRLLQKKEEYNNNQSC
ncbi:hypothetical protein [Clostridium ganghwense]|uniref:DUF2238 domain-containing protein n=1 Tax=Clostridium ganghwense TaxID=312089 RepID=A0ABT4CT84_9CLOT|nr:hypothetical protein [Clostridium ganghwense]MCY6371159.1 hypothetical protein [Clostridium ganghwense]